MRMFGNDLFFRYNKEPNMGMETEVRANPRLEGVARYMIRQRS